MQAIQKLKDLKRQKASAIAEEIISAMVRNNVTFYKKSTCDYHAGAPTEEHRLMPLVCEILQEQGIAHSHAINFGVSDWTFTV